MPASLIFLDVCLVFLGLPGLPLGFLGIGSLTQLDIVPNTIASGTVPLRLHQSLWCKLFLSFIFTPTCFRVANPSPDFWWPQVCTLRKLGPEVLRGNRVYNT